MDGQSACLSRYRRLRQPRVREPSWNDKALADHYPFLIKEGKKRDAEFIAHGITRRQIIHIGMSEEDERQYIRISIAAVENATGKRPIGWSGPDFQETPNTPNLLAAEGARMKNPLWRRSAVPCETVAGWRM